MAVNYICRHCNTTVGSINGGEVSEFKLGFHFLTPEERRDIISYNPNGDITVKVVCEYCTEALQHNPELLLIVNPLQ